MARIAVKNTIVSKIIEISDAIAMVIVIVATAAARIVDLL